MDTGPSLTLLVEKGPRRGESIECRPGDHVRIGRVVRGNTFTIKDPSISQKHATIDFTSADGGGGSWTLTDLDTSNGTFLNSSPLRPLDPAPLKHGDVIKIGEDTSITVRIVELELEVEQLEEVATAVTATGRPTRRAAAARRGRGRGEASRLAAEAEEWKANDSAPGGAVRRTGRARRNVAVSDNTPQLPEDVICPPDAPAEAEEQKDDHSVAESEEHSVQEPEKQPAVPPARAGMRRGARKAVVRESTNGDVDVEHDSVAEPEDHSVQEPEKKPAVPPARAGRRRGARKAVVRESTNGDVDVEHDDVIVLDTPDRREASEKPDTSESQKQPVLGLVDGAVDSTMEGGLAASSPMAAASAPASTEQTAFRESGEEDIDMDNMTLGQWFDRMEKVLPLMLKDICNEIIGDIKEKANHYNAFILESAQR